MRKVTFLTPIILGLICLLSMKAVAQKLPNKQESSIYAPADLKIDGSAKEWQDVFQAYNHAVETWYTVANDNDHLYFIFRATEVEVIQKIMDGGITVSISPADKKSSIVPVAITYPVVPWLYCQVNYALKPPAPLSNADVLAINRKISDHIKEIIITGIKELPDGVVSVYNDQGIKAAHLVDNQKNYTCEISLPLSFIRTMLNEQGTFAYRVQVTGIDVKTTITVGGHSSSDPTRPSTDAVPHGLLFDSSPTYFTALYTLAKKP